MPTTSGIQIESQNEVILITGSSGCIGAALISRLAGRYVLVGLDQPGPPHPAPPAHCLAVDIESDESVDQPLAFVRERCPRLIGLESRAQIVRHAAADN